MTRKRKTTRPASPLEVAHRRALQKAQDRDPSAWGLNAEALDMPANSAVIRQGDVTGRTARARRQDVFDLFLRRGSLSQGGHDAVRRLQDDLAVLHRTQTGCHDFTPRVDRSRAPESFSEARQSAGLRIQSALQLAGAASGRLISALCETDVVIGAASDWRVIVLRETGERLPDAQGALLRVACENLAGAYEILARRRS